VGAARGKRFGGRHVAVLDRHALHRDSGGNRSHGVGVVPGGGYAWDCPGDGRAGKRNERHSRHDVSHDKNARV